MTSLQSKVKDQMAMGPSLAGSGQEGSVQCHANRCCGWKGDDSEDASEDGDGEGGWPQVGILGESYPLSKTQFSFLTRWCCLGSHRIMQHLKSKLNSS